MKKIKNIYFFIISNVFQILQSIIYKDSIIINAYANMQWGKLHHLNWGDDLNYYFIQSITKKKIIIYSNQLISRFFYKKNHLCIGSTISWLTNAKTIIWGSGIISGETKLICEPKTVLAVRGPLTRNYLIKRGIKCPEVYGDPALLLPYHYRPNVNVKYKLGIIPHYIDRDNKYIKMLTSKYNSNIKIIDIVNYLNWYDIIDEICECEFIMSSSLHGLIVSDAYNIPNCWVEFSKKISGGRFKYDDYYLSVDKPVVSPYIIDKEIDISLVFTLKKRWQPPKIDINNLINSCPFKIYLKYNDKTDT